MSQAFVMSARAEASCRLLHRTLGHHRAQAALVDEGNVQRLAAPTFDGVQVQRQATLVRMVSITEAFCVDRLLQMAEQEFEPAGSAVRTVVWEKASVSAVTTWQGIEDSYNGWYKMTPSWTRIRRLAEVRNAIAHGLGRLTRVQLTKRASVSGKIAAAGVKLDGDRVVLEEADLEVARETCLDLITEVDALAQVITDEPR